MPTLMHPRWVLLKEVALNGIDQASALADQIDATDENRGVRINVHLGRAESAVEWMSELLCHYKTVLDTVAVALSQADQATQDDPNVTVALEALYAVQSDYMDGLALGDSDLPGV